MDRRGFLRNIVGSLAALVLPIRAAKPSSNKPNLDEIVFKVTELPPVAWVPGKGWVEIAVMTSEDWARMWAGKSPYVKLEKQG
jgi:hypothetical protein